MTTECLVERGYLSTDFLETMKNKGYNEEILHFLSETQ